MGGAEGEDGARRRTDVDVGPERTVSLQAPDEGSAVPDVGFSLRENPTAARGVAGADIVGLSVADRAAIDAWAARLDELGIAHSPAIDATIGWLLVLHDPDGIEIHLYSAERHGIDQTGRPGYGRVAAPQTAG